MNHDNLVQNIITGFYTQIKKQVMQDSVVEAVRTDLLDRSQIGIKKYGTTLDRSDLTLKEWLQHAYEECLDQANYLKKSILEIEEIEDRYGVNLSSKK